MKSNAGFVGFDGTENKRTLLALAQVKKAASIQGDLNVLPRKPHGRSLSIVAKSNPESPVYHLNLPRTCAQCHADPELVKRHNIRVGNVYQLYMDSIHGRFVPYWTICNRRQTQVHK